MRRSSTLVWLLLGAGIVALVTLTLFGGQTALASTHSSTSDAADGTSALYRVAGRDHVASRLLAGRPAGGGMLFIFSPNEPYSRAEARAVRHFVEGGGTLVYANEVSEPALDAELGLVRESRLVRDLVAYPPGPLLSGVGEVSGGAAAEPFVPESPGQVPVLRGPQQEVLGLEMRLGFGLVVALADPLILCNGTLLRSDNARLAADLLGLAPARAAVVFDESHHVAAAAPAPAPPSGVTPWIAAIIWAVFAGYVALALRGRAFGPPIPLTPPRARSSAEYVDAVGTLLRRSGGRVQALDILTRTSRLALARRRDENDAATAAAGGERSDAELLNAARRLHGLLSPARR